MKNEKKFFIVQGVDGFICGTHLYVQDQTVFIFDNEEVSAMIPLGTAIIIDLSKVVKEIPQSNPIVSENTDTQQTPDATQRIGEGGC